jgi:ribosomal protein L37AE/L43A
MIPIKKEPKELYKEFRYYENCKFCKQPTDTWHEKTNTPVCNKCAKTHSVADLK